jgi:alpha-1,6-mannosyltransferase
MSSVLVKYLLPAISLLGYIFLGYYTERSDFPEVIGWFSLLFLCYGSWIFSKKVKLDWKYIVIVGVVLRCSLIGMTPNLSDDYFRFVWDGRILASGENPYLVMPEDYVKTDSAKALAQDRCLYEGMNSKQYYTVYPPFNQAVFGTAALVAGNNTDRNVLILRLFILLGEIGLMFLIFRLLKEFKMDLRLALLYIFNPLVIIELTGNLHFEGMMLFFLALAVYWLIRSKPVLSAGSMALAVSTKLLPLMLLPFLIKRIGFKKSIIYFGLTGAFIALTFLPFISAELIENFSSSIDLYFRKFEFNASIFYVLRWVGFQTVGYDPIQIIGPLLSGFVLITILVLMWRENLPAGKVGGKEWSALFTAMLMALTVYFAVASIVHPWYIISLVFFSVFSPFRYAIMWSVLAVLSYSFYHQDAYVEQPVLLLFEYLVTGAFLVYELYRNHKSAKALG